jgi:hypothetical protein
MCLQWYAESYTAQADQSPSVNLRPAARRGRSSSALTNLLLVCDAAHRCWAAVDNPHTQKRGEQQMKITTMLATLAATAAAAGGGAAIANAATTTHTGATKTAASTTASRHCPGH